MNKTNKTLFIGILVAVVLIAVAVFVINKNKLMTKGDSVNGTSTSTPALEPIKAAEAGDLVVVHYTGTLENGTKFDSSYDRGEPLAFLLGQGMVIQGWDEAFVGMKRGDKKHLVIPGEKAYRDQEIKGPDGKVLIPKNATLIFDVEVVEVMAKAKVDALMKQREEAQKAMQQAQTSGQQ